MISSKQHLQSLTYTMHETKNHFKEVRVTVNYEHVYISALIKASCTSLGLFLINLQDPNS